MEHVAGHAVETAADVQDSDVARHMTTAALAAAAFGGIAATFFPHIDLAAAHSMSASADEEMLA